eukprot:gnl/MRDRNA2_/MRDRNA2_96984_c0_seq1.p1 gnl/MRDRNA2_/MRDRNA2_96984_c0~~gnl/MRDRNA2_/MRDRNA2_96984_c0_seq1.p1  ORF type:complete len:916 (+),score=241.58 gnl/MRDRNA2_/MRDRNA2_96984_c0_seq1:87-2834(+)
MWGSQWGAQYTHHDASNQASSSGYNYEASGYNSTGAYQGRYPATSGGASASIHGYHAASGNPANTQYQYSHGQANGPTPRGSIASMSASSQSAAGSSWKDAASAAWKGPQLGPGSATHASYQAGYQTSGYSPAKPVGAHHTAGGEGYPAVAPKLANPHSLRPEEPEVSLDVSACSDPAVSQIVQGKYTRSGENHGKPIFKKTEKSIGAPDGVLIYFWDTRDGRQNAGWWFGPQVGGEQVWSHNENISSSLPPSIGWKIPFDGPVDAVMKVTPIENEKKRTAEDAVKGHEPSAKQARTDSHAYSPASSSHAKPMLDWKDWKPGESDNPETVVRTYMTYLSRCNLDNYQEIAAGLEKFLAEARGGVMSWRKQVNDCLEATRRRLSPSATQMINQSIGKIKYANPETFESCRDDLLAKQKKLKGIPLAPGAPGPDVVEKAIENAQKRVELLAALPLRKLLQKLKDHPGEIVEIQKQLIELMRQQREKLGSLTEKLEKEIEDALVGMQKKIIDQEKEKAAKEEFDKEQAEEAEKLQAAIAELREVADKSKEEATKAVEFSTSSEDPEEEARLCDEAENNLTAARALVDASLNGIKEKATEVMEKLRGLLALIKERGLGTSAAAPVRERLTKAQLELNSIRDELLQSGQALTKAEASAKDLKEKATRKVVAAKKEKEQQELFAKYAGEGREVLVRADVVEFAKVEYELSDLSEEFQAKIDSIVGEEGLPYARFSRLRQALAIERSEVRAREKKRQEEEARQKAHEEMERRKKELADRKLQAQQLLDEAVESQEDADEALPKAEEAAKPLLSDEKLSAKGLQEAANATETALEPVTRALQETKSKLDEVEQLLGPELKKILEKDLTKAQAKHEKCSHRVERLHVEAKAAQERSAKKVGEEQKAKKRVKDFKKLQAAYDDYA